MLAVFELVELVKDVILEVLLATEFVNDVMLAVFDAIDVGKVAIVVELTPPTVFTDGEVAVPPKSPANCILPLVVKSASGVAAFVTNEDTNAVVAI